MYYQRGRPIYHRGDERFFGFLFGAPFVGGLLGGLIGGGVAGAFLANRPFYGAPYPPYPPYGFGYGGYGGFGPYGPPMAAGYPFY
ncbi:hypothetical protein [Bacillus sp. FJAT-29937]|uniref:hypothetical protein n=1 Tax=Bacillus sp. FJAT-29937 TaxID=1720553 RepID=UPI00082B9838|nr:hypothetical protein [Bacillus sp. FJAT-29937]